MILAALKINKAKARFTTGNDPFGGGDEPSVMMRAGYVGSACGQIHKTAERSDCSYWLHSDKSLYIVAKRNPDGLRR